MDYISSPASLCRPNSNDLSKERLVRGFEVERGVSLYHGGKNTVNIPVLVSGVTDGTQLFILWESRKQGVTQEAGLDIVFQKSPL